MASSRGVMATRLTSNQKIMGSTPIVSVFYTSSQKELLLILHVSMMQLCLSLRTESRAMLNACF